MAQVVFFGEAEKRGVFAGPGSFPVPVFADLCACCNAASTATVAVDPSNDHTLSDSVAVPVCSACVGHLPRRETFGKFKAVFFGVAVLAILGVMIAGATGRLRRDPGVPALFGGALALAALVTAALAVVRLRWLGRWSAQGHHRNFALLAGFGWSGVKTNNDALAQRLLASGGHHKR